MKEKKELRRRIRACIAAHTPQELERMSEDVIAALERHPLFRSARSVMLYHSMPTEVDTRPLLQRWACSKELWLPLMEGDRICAKRYKTAEDLQTGAFGIREPKQDAPSADPQQLDLVVVPGMAFDRHGNRLGHGKGYYDRFLRPLSVPRIGICFPFQLVEDVPHDELDCRMDEVICG